MCTVFLYILNEYCEGIILMNGWGVREPGVDNGCLGNHRLEKGPVYFVATADSLFPLSCALIE